MLKLTYCLTHFISVLDDSNQSLSDVTSSVRIIKEKHMGRYGYQFAGKYSVRVSYLHSRRSERWRSAVKLDHECWNDALDFQSIADLPK